MGWGPVDDWVEKGTERVGEGIDSAGGALADSLDDVGWKEGAQVVRSGKNWAANHLGADTDELQLGQTRDEKELVHGSAGKLRSTAGHLKDFKSAFEKVGKGLRGVDSSGMRGEAADAFREKAAAEPKKWFKAADASEKAANALEDFAGTVEWAQGRAKEAIEQWDKAQKESGEAREAHNKQVDAYNRQAKAYNSAAASGGDPGPRPTDPGDFQDPGPGLEKKAQETLDAARKQRNEAEGRVRTSLQAARDAAPPKPSAVAQMNLDTEINLDDMSHVGGGVIYGAAGMVSTARTMNPIEPYNLTHPAQFATNLNNTSLGIYQAARNPKAAAEAIADSYRKDKGDFIGALLPEVAAGKGTGLLRGGLKGALKGGGRHEGGDSGRGHLDGNGDRKNDTDGPNRPCDGTDPVDLTTGKMFLPQTDVTLPGALPLVFRRQVESGYRLGRWFGPSWTSTVDQRLEVDAEGVVYISEDGLVLSYPHPGPGLPTLPSAGPRMPLERAADGGFTLTDPDTGWVRHFGPPEDGVDGDARIEQLSDRNGNCVVFEYDEATGTPVRIGHSGGYELRFTVEAGRITALSLTDTVLMRYGYTDGNLTDVVNSSGLPLRFAYDDERRVISWTDTNDRRYDYVYDHHDRCIAEGGTAGHLQVRIGYDEVDGRTGHKVTTLTTAEGHSTRHLVNDRYQVVAVTDALGNTVHTDRDAFNRPLRRTDALGRVTAFAYDEAGRLSGVVRPDGREATVDRNHLGLPVEIREADGAVWRNEFDEHGNRIAATDPAGQITRYAYDAHGNLAGVTNALGETTRVRCDKAGLPVEITDPLGAITRYERDAFGRPVALTDPLGAVSRLEWTVEGKLTRRTDPDGAVQSWTYDGEGNCTRHVDANGGETTYEYTHFDVLAAQTGPDGVRYAFDHDAELRLTQVTNPHGLTWSYEYDPAGRLVSETDFDDRTQSYTHDAAGQLIARINPLSTSVTYERDELSNIVRKAAGDRVTTFAYDTAGRMVEAIGPDGEVRWQRDKLGRIKSEMTGSGVLTHSYDALGRRTRRVTPTGAVSTFAYDAAGNRTTVTANGHTLDFTHDAAGRETGRRIGDGLTLSHLWDPWGRLTSQTLTGHDAATIQHRAYTYRVDGYLTGIEDQLTGGRNFDLDAAGRVTAVHARGWTETYAYDEAGNQTHAAWPTAHAAPEAIGARNYTGTRITSAGKIRYEHDDAGRITLRQKTRLSKKPDTWRYTWDAEDRLSSVTTPDGTVWRYLYDPMGRRTAKQRLSGDGETVIEQVDFTWDGPTLIEQTTTAPDLPHPVTLTWDHEGFTPLSQTERLTDTATQAEIDSRFFAIVTDLVGTPSELVDESGDIAWRTRTTLWGTTTWNADSSTYTPLRFPGQYYDPETGLHYNFHRYYDPTTARYTTPDPLGLTPAPNPATYVRNPHAGTDVLGLAPGDCPPSTGKEVVPHNKGFARRQLEN
ncbi:MAG: putative T7SS-secreted protein, partial [Streptomyces sp.]|uniref:putative T7SS-secreted protein n=1 Tax=Streptomyces sp. TaxID=1931 RepID=UPI003D6BD982